MAAYREAWRLLLRCATDRIGKQRSQLDMADLDAPFLGGFLDHLEAERASSVPASASPGWPLSVVLPLRGAVPSRTLRAHLPSVGHPHQACRAQQSCPILISPRSTQATLAAMLAAGGRAIVLGRWGRWGRWDRREKPGPRGTAREHPLIGLTGSVATTNGERGGHSLQRGTSRPSSRLRHWDKDRGRRPPPRVEEIVRAHPQLGRTGR